MGQRRKQRKTKNRPPVARSDTKSPGADRRRPKLIPVIVILVLVLIVGALIVMRPSTPPPAAVRPFSSGGLDSELLQLVNQQIARVNHSPGLATEHATLGLIYEANAMWHEATECFKNAVELDATEPMWMNHLASVLSQAGRFDDAFATLERLTTQHPSFAPGYQRHGYALLRMGRMKEAADRFESCRKLASSEVPGLVGLGEVYVGEHRFEEAIRLLNRAVSLDPNYELPHYLLGLAYRGLGQQDQAAVEMWRGLDVKVGIIQDDASRLMQQFARGPASLLSRARQFAASGRLAQAVELLERGLESRPRDTRFLNNLAVVYGQQGRHDKALDVLSRALSIDDGEFATHINLTDMMLRTGNQEKALFHAQRATELAPGLGQAHHSLGRVLISLGRLDEARHALQTSWRLDTRDPEVELLLGSVCAEIGDHREARRHFRAVTERIRNRAEPFVRLGLTCLHLGDRDEAEQALLRAKQIAPADPAIRLLERQLRGPS